MLTDIIVIKGEPCTTDGLLIPLIVITMFEFLDILETKKKISEKSKIYFGNRYNWVKPFFFIRNCVCANSV